MKQVIPLVLLTVFFISCQKEIDNNLNTTNTPPQITSATVIASMAPNTRISGYSLDSGIVSVPVAGTGITYNYANVVQGAAWNDSLKTPVNTVDFPNATYMTGLNQSFLGQPITANQYFQISTTAWNNLGGYLGLPLNINNSGYSLSVPVQALKNNPVQTLVNFPVRYNDSINLVSVNTLNAQLGVTINNINISGPLTTTTTTTVKSKNISYGYLKITGYPDSMQVVVQRYISAVKTNISSSNLIINSLLTTLLGQLNITNDQVINDTVYRFWAKDKGLVMRREGNGKAYVRTGL